MEEIRSLAKKWNNEVVVPSLTTSLCMVLGPGALSRLRNLTISTLFGLGGQNAPLRIFAKYLKNDSADLHETL